MAGSLEIQMLAKSLKTTGFGGPGRRAVPFGDGRGVPGLGCACWVGMWPLLGLPRFDVIRLCVCGLLVGLKFT